MPKVVADIMLKVMRKKERDVSMWAVSSKQQKGNNSETRERTEYGDLGEDS